MRGLSGKYGAFLRRVAFAVAAIIGRCRRPRTALISLLPIQPPVAFAFRGRPKTQEMGLNMKTPGLIALAILMSGCAAFGGGGKSAPLAADAAPLAQAPARTAAETFRPAYGIGRPVALVPCARGATLNDDCVGGETRHQLGGGRVSVGDEPSLSESILKPVAE